MAVTAFLIRLFDFGLIIAAPPLDNMVPCLMLTDLSQCSEVINVLGRKRLHRAMLIFYGFVSGSVLV